MFNSFTSSVAVISLVLTPDGLRDFSIDNYLSQSKFDLYIYMINKLYSDISENLKFVKEFLNLLLKNLLLFLPEQLYILIRKPRGSSC
jgi:hypothetical protein